MEEKAKMFSLRISILIVQLVHKANERYKRHTDQVERKNFSFFADGMAIQSEIPKCFRVNTCNKAANK